MRWLAATVAGVGFAGMVLAGMSCAADNEVSVAPEAGTTMEASLDGPSDARVRRPGPLRVLFFTRETLFFHTDAHKLGDDIVPAYLRTRGHEVTVTGDSTTFIAQLPDNDVALFFVTSGVVFDTAQRAVFEAFIRSGGGFAGVHAASATEIDSPFFVGLVGATFWGHGVGDAGLTVANLDVVDAADPLVSFLPNPWSRRDEWYFFTSKPAENPALTQLLRVEESSLPDNYPDAGRTGLHPLSWKQHYMGGRSFYTALGHTGASYQDELFVRSIALGVEWAGGMDAP